MSQLTVIEIFVSRIAFAAVLLFAAIPQEATADHTAYMVKDISGTSVSWPEDLINVDGTLYFSASGSVGGLELWRSDGTAEGTVMVKDTRPGERSGYPRQITNVNGMIYFMADDGDHGTELWKSDGTAEGTVMVKDINTYKLFGVPLSSYPCDFTNVNGIVYFTAEDEWYGEELWKSDGTPEGTMLVKDINARSSNGSNPNELTNLNGVLYFSADDGLHGSELWMTNGTGKGTVMVKDLNTTSHSFPQYLTVIDEKLYFEAFDDDATSNHDKRIWKSNGTKAGTVLAKDVNSLHFVNVNGVHYFTNDDETYGSELWRDDGTEGIRMIKDISPGPRDSNPSHLTNINGMLYFAADDDVHGVELWRSDGTEEGTVLVIDIRTDSWNSQNLPSYPRSLVNVGGVLYFAATDHVHGEELWRSDGTSEGTMMVEDIYSGSGSSQIDSMTNVRGTLFFSAWDGNDSKLWAYCRLQVVNCQAMNCI